MSETPAETIRRAAAKMRERAEAVDERDYERVTRKVGRLTSNGQHIASWHPAVALAVAAWLEKAAERADFYGPRYFTSPFREGTEALVVANAYLGEVTQ